MSDLYSATSGEQQDHHVLMYLTLMKNDMVLGLIVALK